MISPISRKSGLALLALLAMTFGACGSKYVYKPDAPGAPTAAAASSSAALPIKAAVIAFGDGTEDFKKKGSFFSGYEFNLAKTGINGLAINTGAAYDVSPLPPESWAKAFAEDLRASGAFRSVSLVLDGSGLSDEELVVEGTLVKATFRTKKGEPDEFLLRLKARRAPGGTVVWEGDVSRSAPRPPELTSGCLIGSCVIERIHGYFGTVMQGMFAEARSGLIPAAAPPAEKRPASPAAGESVDAIVNRILGKP